jgi:glutathione S-transferase
MHYAVLYFDIRGRAEPIRLLLAAEGAAFDDQAVVREEWARQKATLPLGQVPVLTETDGAGARQIPHSQAILRHLGRVFDRTGAGASGQLQADLVAETVYDLRVPLAPHMSPMTRGKDPAGLQAVFRDALPVHLARLERVYGGRPVGAELFAGPRITWADCLAYDLLDHLLAIQPTSLDAFAGLQAFVAAFRADPRIAAYVPRQRPSELAALRTVLETGQPL